MMSNLIKLFVIPAIIILTGSCFVQSSNEPDNQPNILFIMADDCSYNAVGCFGGKNAKTPNIDRIAKEGILFNRAYVGMAMCAPCRQELYSGLYPLESGAAWNHSISKPGTKSVFHYLTDLGYRVGISGKTHVGPKEAYPFISVPGFESRGPAWGPETEDYTGIKSFFDQDVDQPFCLFVCATSPHAPWTKGDSTQYPPDKIILPAVLGDTPEVRAAFARYLAEVTYFDKQVGDVISTLEETGKAKNTIIMISTEQGWQFSGAKWTNWNQGVHTGLVVKWPGRISEGRKTDALVQFADVTPTLIDVAGGKEIEGLAGTSFLDVLVQNDNEHRKYVYCMHNNVPEGTPYPIRSIINDEFHYITNLLPDSLYFEKHLEGRAHGAIWWDRWKEAAETSERERFLVERFYKRPAEELYSVKDDPNQFNNLADNPEYVKVKKKLRKELDKWMESQEDPGAVVDTPESFARKYWDN
jgi:N-sulfoglucosamine sulfohydrolase